MAILGERVLHHPGEGAVLLRGRDDLQADRIVGVVGVDQAHEVRRDVDAEPVRDRQPLALGVGQVQDLLDLGEVVHAVAELPAPVVPLLIGHVRPHRGPATHGGTPVGSEGAGRIEPVDERGLSCGSGRILVGDRRLDLLGVQLSRPPGCDA